MLRYLIVVLDDTSTSFCHYPIGTRQSRLMPLDVLEKSIRWAMIENLMIQFVYPAYELPTEWKEAIESIDHVKIKPSTAENTIDADVIVFDKIEDVEPSEMIRDKSIVIRTSINAFFHKYEHLNKVFPHVGRVNVVFTDVESFSDEDVDTYRDVLSQMAAMVKREYLEGHPMQFNLLTDRMMLTEMNNCGAGDSAITLAPDGHFYICPSFYYDRDDRFDVGNLATGLKIPNQQLYKLQYAPICRRCDAFQCHRCVWLNRRTTLEVNTPSHQQCVVSHIERNASRALLQSIREEGEFLPDTEIEEINHLDPFEIVTK